MKELSVMEMWQYKGTSEDFPDNSDTYFAMYAIETYGSACRDNTRSELIAIGKRLEREGNEL